jgi:phytoene synthase
MTALAAAYAECNARARSHYENFPIGSWLLPRRLRDDLAAVYAFARLGDDVADEGDATPAERLDRLAEIDAQLVACAADPAAARDPVFLALGHTIARHALPVAPFRDLLAAFRRDAAGETHRFATFDDVLAYCRCSANPVGRIVLGLFGHRDAERAARSDDICTALQLTNFWQDLAIDWSRGRLYVPEEIWRSHQAQPARLDSGQMTPEWLAALRDCSARTRALFVEGRPVCDGVSGRLRYELRATWLGGTRILDRLDRSGFEVFRARPKLGPADALVIACGTLLWPATPPSPTRS